MVRDSDRDFRFPPRQRDSEPNIPREPRPDRSEPNTSLDGLLHRLGGTVIPFPRSPETEQPPEAGPPNESGKDEAA